MLLKKALRAFEDDGVVVGLRGAAVGEPRCAS